MRHRTWPCWLPCATRRSTRLNGWALWCRSLAVGCSLFGVVGPCALSGVWCAVFSIFLSLDGLYQPLVLNTKSDKPQAEIVRKYVPEGRVYSYRTHVNPGNLLHPFTINYYLGDRVVPFIEFMPNEGYLLVGDNDIESFYERYPNYRVTEVVDFNHRSCDDRRMLHFYHFQRQ